MSMSTHIIAFFKPKEKWKKYKAIWDACNEAGVEPPDEVSKYFDYEDPKFDRGIRDDLTKHECCMEWNKEMESGYEIDVSKLPANVTHIRFFNSY